MREMLSDHRRRTPMDTYADWKALSESYYLDRDAGWFAVAATTSDAAPVADDADAWAVVDTPYDPDEDEMPF
jgi:hypothetical protein